MSSDHQLGESPMTIKKQAGYRPGGSLCLIRSLAASAVLGAVALGTAPLASAQVTYAALAGSYQPSRDMDVGQLNLGSMTVEVVLAPANQAELAQTLADVYNSKSANYQRWLAKGEFAARFAPSARTVAEVTDYLQASGLTVQPSSSPFLLRASGSSHTIEAAFGTTLHNYLNAHGVSYFANASEVQVPATLASSILGVVGLSNTVRTHNNIRLPDNAHRSKASSCEAHYPTREQLYAAVNNGTPFPFGYGAAPGCNGLTPSQINSMYEAPPASARTEGKGINFAVFELSWYQRSDIDTWAQHYYGTSYTPPLTDVVVDGGPLAPICPAGDQCPPQYEFYSGDIEVDA